MSKIAEKSVTKKRGGPRPNSGGARPGAGRKPFEPTDHERRQVESLAGFGLPIEQIATLVRDGVHADTVRARFQAEIERGRARASAAVGRCLYQRAMGGDTTAMIWWSKTQMGWRETQRHEVAGHDGGQLVVRIIKPGPDD